MCGVYTSDYTHKYEKKLFLFFFHPDLSLTSLYEIH